MPEGHTIHHAARQQRLRLRDQHLSVTSPQGRFGKGAAKLDGRSLTAIEAHGKHLLYRWDSAQILHVHLGLYGRFRWQKTPPEPPRGAVRMRIVGEDHTLDLHGPTACEILSPKAHRDLLNRLGPDPLCADADTEAAWNRIRKSRAAIGTLLLDQSVIAGIGNVYRAELLFALGMHPERSGRSLTREEFDELWATISNWLAIGARNNRIITTTDELGKSPSRIAKAERLAIYKKDFCNRCQSRVESWPLAGRTIYACPLCQASPCER